MAVGGTCCFDADYCSFEAKAEDGIEEVFTYEIENGFTFFL